MPGRVLTAVIVFLFLSCSVVKPPQFAPGDCLSGTTAPGILEGLGIPPHKLKDHTGVHTLEDGGESLVSRLWLLMNARKTLDIQYYMMCKDVTGLLACDLIVRAAERGVKVRLLVDDAATKMSNSEMKAFDAHENIEVRVYNPGLKLGTVPRRLQKLSENYVRVLRRMHNKTFTADGVVTILGGRNIGDEYYDFDHRYNFRDRDVMLIGKEVRNTTASFDAFWNDALTVKFEEMAGRYRKKQTAEDRFKKLHAHACDTVCFSKNMREQVRNYGRTFHAIQSTPDFAWFTDAVFVSDIPGKNEDRPNQTGGVTTDSVLAILRNAKQSIEIQSPYVISTDSTRRILTDIMSRGVTVRVLTNSMASTDNHEAFSGYQRDRSTLLKMGIDIFEFRPDAEVRFKRMCPEVQRKLNYKPAYGLHSKTIVVDGFVTIIGSYNFDPRSANYNTECIVIVRSHDFAERMLDIFREEIMPGNAWHVTEDYNPDEEAALYKHLKTTTRHVFPKKIL